MKLYFKDTNYTCLQKDLKKCTKSRRRHFL